MKSALLAEGGEKQCVVLQALSEAEMGGGGDAFTEVSELLPLSSGLPSSTLYLD